jgi:hypothetical protein
VDPGYPYVGAVLGAYGFDLGSERLIDPSHRDLMSYCRPRWVSDYTYVNVMAFRQAAAEGGTSAQRWEDVRPSLVVWGRIVDGQPVLEPAFLLHTRPSTPARSGPYRLEATDASGRRVFTLTFAGSRVADAARDEEHFAFAIPLDPPAVAGLSRLVLRTQSGMAERAALVAVRTDPAPPPELLRVAGRTELHWDSAAAPMALVRDPSNGQILALGRGGVMQVPDAGRRLEIHLSDGVSSHLATPR